MPDFSIGHMSGVWYSKDLPKDPYKYCPGFYYYSVVVICQSRLVLRTMLALSSKDFSVSAPSVWNSLAYNCRSAERLSTFRRNLKTELFDIAYSEHEHST